MWIFRRDLTSIELTERSVVHDKTFLLIRSVIYMLIVIIISLFSFRRNWKRRWFVLKDNVLTYHETDMDGAKSLGTIDIRNAV